MKFKFIFIWTSLFLSVILSGCSASKGLTKEEKLAKEAELLEALEKRTFIVEVDRVFPTNGNPQALTSTYSLAINGDEVKSYLPFFGRAYSLPYGGGEGLIFESTLTDYQSVFDNKGKATITFKTKSKDDQFNYRIQIYPNGTASIDVTSINRQKISFNGKVK